MGSIQKFPYILIKITASDKRKMQRLGRKLVESRIVASSHIVQIESFFIWDEKYQNPYEWELEAITRSDLYNDIQKIAREELPDARMMAFYIPVMESSFTDWIDSSLAVNYKDNAGL